MDLSSGPYEKLLCCLLRNQLLLNWYVCDNPDQPKGAIGCPNDRGGPEKHDIEIRLGKFLVYVVCFNNSADIDAQTLR